MSNKIVAVVVFMLLSVQFLFAQKAGKISGTVTDKSDKSTLIGVTIALKGTSFGTVTDIDGNYSINNIPNGIYNIECSYVGYERIFITGIKISGGEEKNLMCKWALVL